MKLQTLIYFIQIANEGSFTKAAAKCFVSQPALSKSINELETELSCQLFERHGRTIELTESGEVVYKYATEILHQCELLKEKVMDKNTKNNPLKVGYIIYGHMNYLQKRLQNVDSINIEPLYDSACKIREYLISDKIDMAILPRPCEQGLEGIKIHYSPHRHMYILVHRNHPLYLREEIRFEDLKETKIVNWDEEDLMQVALAYKNQFIIHGITPQIIATGKKLGDITMLMIQHKAVGLCGPITSHLPMEEFKTIPIVDSDECFGLCIVWKEGNTNPLLQKITGNL